MKKLARARFGILVIAGAAAATVGCDARLSAPAASPPTSAAATTGSEPDFTYESFVELIGNPDHFAVARILGERLPKIGPGSLPALQKVLEDSPTLELNATEFELLMRYWARFDAPGATFYAFANAPRAFRVSAILATVRTWAAIDPQSALQTVGSWTMEGGDAGTAAQIALVRGWYDSGKPGLEQYIHDLGASLERQRSLSAYATAVIRAHGPGEVVRWAEAVSPDDAGYKLEVFRNVASALVPFDLDAARHFCDKHCEGPFGSHMRDRIASRWVERDGAAALEWLGQAPAGEGRDVALRFGFVNWAQIDTEKAVQWMTARLDEKPQPEYLEAMWPVYARAVGQTHPVEGLERAQQIKGPQDRENITVQILRGWRWRDEPAMEAWLKQANLPQSIVARAHAPQTLLEKRDEEDRRRRASVPTSPPNQTPAS
jgi:hypothetical protein